MKTPVLITILSLWAAVSYAQGGYVDDLYRGSTKKARQAEAEAKTIQQRPATTSQSKQAMPVTWTPAQTSSSPVQSGLVSDAAVGKKELITSYDEALQRRLDAYQNYKEMDDSYWQLMENYNKMLTNKYDQDLYNVITFGNEMWVEPRYISALFDGSDPAAGVLGKELLVSQPKSNVTINVGVNLSPWGWNDPWDYSWGWGSRWNYYSYWNRPYWGSSWGWGPSWGWGGGYYPGWGPSWGWGGPGYYPPYYPGGGHHHHYYPSRPVIWGNNSPGYRPGSGSGSSGRPGYSGGYRRNENGTNVIVGSGSGSTRPGARPGSAIRPGGTGNQYNPGTSRPSTGSGQTTRPTERPSTGNYRRETTTTPTQRREPSYTPQRETRPAREPSSYTPSQSSGSSSSGSSGGGGGGFSTGGGSRRR